MTFEQQLHGMRSSL